MQEGGKKEVCRQQYDCKTIPSGDTKDFILKALCTKDATSVLHTECL